MIAHKTTKKRSKLSKRAVGGLLYGAALAALCLALLWVQGAFLAPWADWQQKSAVCALGADGEPLTLTLQDRRFTAARGQTVLWQGEPNWKVQDFLVGDIDGDGRTELLLLVWRRGNYGPSRPFWVRSNDTSYSQHLFIYKWDGDAPTPVWMSSRLAPQIKAWALTEQGRFAITTRSGEDTLWGWQGWGVVRLG